MDRNKTSTKPGRRGIPAGEMIALGPKRRTDASTEGLRSSTPPVLSERKREAPSISGNSGSLPKKPKLPSPTPLGKPINEFPKVNKPSQIISSSRSAQKFLDVPAKDLVEKVLEADTKEDDKRIDVLLCGALFSLKNSRARPDPALFLGLLYLAKTKPMLFETENVVDGVCSLLRRDISISFKSKGNPLVPVLACNILMHAFLYEDNWPDVFVKVYIEDATAERVWVEHQKNQEFVSNVITAFGTKPIPKHLSGIVDLSRSTAILSESGGGGSPSRQEEIDIDSVFGLASEENTESKENINNRFASIKESIESYVVNFLKEQLNRRQGMDIPRNLLRLLATTCGLIEVRLMTASKLELWLQNPKLTRPAQELLSSLCVNCGTHSPQDVEVIGLLTRMRVKTKPLINHYLLSIRELLSQHPENLPTVLKHTIYNELSSSRNPNNMSVLSSIFQHYSGRAAKVLASAFQTLLVNKEDYVRAVRALFREIVKTLRYDINFSTFCLSLMAERTDVLFTELDSTIKERYLKSIIDVICLASMLSVTPQVREAVNAFTRGDHKDVDVIRKFQKQISMIQRDSVWWMHTIVPKMLTMAQKDFQEQLQKLLFMKSADSYCSKDNWPPEADRSLLLSLLSEVPVEEDCLIRLLIMGLTRDIHLGPGDAIDLVDKMVKRAAVLHTDEINRFPVLKIERLQLIDALLNCCSYHHPENISLPEGYQPPSLAIVNLYWKNWVILLILAAFNPVNIGKTGWEHYPTLRSMMEMMMTNNFKFPPTTLATNNTASEEFRANERQMNQLEKEKILEFENHLAAVTIIETNSLLLAQLIHMNPSGPARRPPQSVLDQLQHLNKVLKLGHMLCKSREPDFLLDIIHRQGTSQSMSWLAELVNSSDTSLDMLPVQCLCEFLMNAHQSGSEEASTSSDTDSKEKQLTKQTQLCVRLQAVLYQSDSRPETTCEILEYFLKKLAMVQSSQRTRSLEVLAMVISKSATEEDDISPSTGKSVNAPPQLLKSHAWLLKNMQMLPNVDLTRSLVALSLRKAMQMETDPATVSAYIAYLAHNVTNSELPDLVQDLAQLIVERLTILTNILPRCGFYNDLTNSTLTNMLYVFSRYIQRATSAQNEGYSWSDTQDQVFLHWESGQSATMHILVVHAMVIILSYGPPKDPSNFEILLGAWFPDKGSTPSAYLVDTSEEALLFPDWLKLRMIRSSVQKLVDAALQELEPAQLVLFVQSFGIPIKSVSKLLAHLDAAVEQMPSAMEQAVAAKAYMARLVEVQQMRGASGGNKFKMLLMGDQPKSEEEGTSKDVTDKPTVEDVEMKEADTVSTVKEVTWNQSDCYDHLRKLFLDSTVGQEEKQKICQTFQKMLMKDQNRKTGLPLPADTRGGAFSWAVKGLLAFVLNDEDRASVIITINKFTNMVSAIFRILLQKESKMKSLHGPMLLKIIVALQNTHCIRDASLNKFLKHYRGKLEATVADSQVDKDTEMEEPNNKDRLMLNQGDIHDLLQTSPESLFARSSVADGSEENIYPLALLTHQTDWNILQKCIYQLLEADPNRYNASTVLDFLWACLHNPKIWQGRDTRASKRRGEENILALSTKQSCQIVSYIVLEASDLSASSHSTSSTTFSSKDKALLSKIQLRMDLLMKCCIENQQSLKIIVQFLDDQIRNERPLSKWYQVLLTELYLQMPEIIQHISEDGTSPQFMLSSEHSSLPSGIDSFCHRLLTLLASESSSIAGRQRKLDALAALRKLASSHPTLLMRQLPMLAVLLCGRTHLNLRDFRMKGHVIFFNHVLTILLLLQPHLFQAKPQDLEAIFTSYFDLLKHYGTSKSFLSFIVTKFVELLCQYYQANSSDAKAVLHNYMNGLNFISQSRPDLPILKSLLASLSLAEETKDHAEEGFSQDNATPLSLNFSEEIPGVGGSREDTASPIPAILQSDTKPMSADEINDFQKRLRRDNDPEMIEMSLNDLDDRCIDETELLTNFKAELANLMTTSETECRALAFSLAIRLCKHQPSTSSSFLSSFLEVLQNGDEDAMKCALNHLPEFSLLCQEHAPLLLQKAFSRGLESSLDTAPAISETMQMLNMEAASVSVV